MKLRLILGLCLALFLLALPTAAGAALPKAKSTLIDPNHSIAGVTLGADAAQVKAAWGGKTCKASCSFEGPAVTGGSPTFANVLLEKKGAKNKVWLITIGVSFVSKGKETAPNFNTPLAAWKTSKGIGLGSKVGEFEAAYPKAEKVPTSGGPFFSLKGPGRSYTTFVTAENRVVTIAVESHPAG